MAEVFHVSRFVFWVNNNIFQMELTENEDSNHDPTYDSDTNDPISDKEDDIYTLVS